MLDLNFENAYVTYSEKYLPNDQADQIFALVSELFINEENKMIYDNMDQPMYKLNRKTIVFVDPSVDKNIVPKIWGKNVTVLEFPQELLVIKEDLQSKLNFEFNICLANYYVSGKNTIGWHSDNEEKGSTSCIASISVGAEREFAFRKLSSKEICHKLVLHNGSLIVMGNGCQENYQHRLLQDKNCKIPRLNLTFRLFDNDRYKNY